MTRIVFVEEHAQLEAQVGATLDRWEVHHACGPKQALDLIESLGGTDVLITDMDMEAMDGAELLEIVRDRFPATARIVLSGRSSRDALLRAVGPAHQYLSAPVDIDELIHVIEHVAGASLRDPIRSLVGQADRLPSPPYVFQRLMEMTASDDWTTNGVADLLGQDVALTSAMMKLVNSTFFGFFGEVTSVERAVSLLGVDLVRSIVLGSKLFATDPAIRNWLDLEQLDRRSKAIAHGAHVLATRAGTRSDEAAAAHLAGMVAEVGMLVMARVPDIDDVDAAPLNDTEMPEVERLLFGGDRFEVGGHLLRLWGFPDSIVEAVSTLSASAETPPTGLARYLRAARQLVMVEGFDESAFALVPGESPEFDHALTLLATQHAGVPA